MAREATLRGTLDDNEFIFAPGVFHALDARIAAYTGHDAVYVSGGATNKGLYGVPDGHIGMSEMVANVHRIAEVIDIPSIADADTGYGSEGHIRRTIRNFDATGVGGIHIEDQQFPKTCGQSSEKTVVSRREAEQRLDIARNEVDALGSELLVIPRVDAFDAANGGWDEGVERIAMYAERGFDIVFPELHGPSPADVIRLATEVHETHPNVEFLFNYNAAHRWADNPDALSFEELSELGCKIIIAPLAGLYAGSHAVFDHFEDLAENGHEAQFNMERRWHDHGPFDGISDALTGMGANNFFEL